MPTQAEWEASGLALFGEDKSRWAFECPACGNAMSIERARAEFPELKSSDWRPEQECAGRYTDRVNGKNGKRCDWCAYGLFRGPLIVKANSGNEVPVFDFAKPPPPASRRRERGDVTEARDNKRPPRVVWVSYCGRCGEPIFASRKRQDTSCPTCSIVGLTKRQFPKIRHARYSLDWSR